MIMAKIAIYKHFGMQLYKSIRENIGPKTKKMCVSGFSSEKTRYGRPS